MQLKDLHVGVSNKSVRHVLKAANWFETEALALNLSAMQGRGGEGRTGHAVGAWLACQLWCQLVHFAAGRFSSSLVLVLSQHLVGSPSTKCNRPHARIITQPARGQTATGPASELCRAASNTALNDIKAHMHFAGERRAIESDKGSVATIESRAIKSKIGSEK